MTFHVLRHIAASLMVQNGVSIFEVAKTLGHSTTTMTMRYAHFAPEATQEAIDRLGDALSGPKDEERPSNEGGFLAAQDPA